MLRLQKSQKKIITVSATWWNLFDIFFLTHRSILWVGKGTK